MSARYVYSFDRVTFIGQFETRSDALRAALKAAHQQADAPTEVYVAAKVSGDPQTTGHAEAVIHNMRDRARAATDNAARYLLNVGEQEEADLDHMLAATITEWLEKHELTPTFYRVESISEHPVPSPSQTVARNQDDKVSEIGTGEPGTQEFPLGR